MADNLADIEVLLKRSEQWNVVKPLSEKFAVLSQQEAQKLMERLLSFAPGDREPVDFRGFDREIRLHLLEMLIERLGPREVRAVLDPAHRQRSSRRPTCG